MENKGHGVYAVACGTSVAIECAVLNRKINSFGNGKRGNFSPVVDDIPIYRLVKALRGGITLFVRTRCHAVNFASYVGGFYWPNTRNLPNRDVILREKTGSTWDVSSRNNIGLFHQTVSLRKIGRQARATENVPLTSSNARTDGRRAERKHHIER